MKENIEKRLIGVFLVMLAVMVFVAISSVRNNQRSIASTDWVDHTHATMLEANAILTSLHAGDASLRSFLLTGDDHDQGSYRNAYADMVKHLEVAKALTRGEPAQNAEILKLEKLIKSRVDFTRGVVGARKTDGLDGARKALAPDSDGVAIGDIQRLVQGLNNEENDLLRKRNTESVDQAKTTTWIVNIGVAANFVLLGFVGWLIRDDLAARRRAAVALEEANAQLEAKVKERTAELVKANESLTQENLERRWSNQALDHQLRYSQLIINSIGDLIFVISKALNVSRINPAVIHATNMEAKEIIAQPIDRVLRLLPDGTSGALLGQNPISLAMKEGREIQDRPATLLTHGGRTKPVLFNVVPMRDQNKVVGAVVTVRVVKESAS
jgi:CHASE3 domain sensor protein